MVRGRRGKGKDFRPWPSNENIEKWKMADGERVAVIKGCCGKSRAGNDAQQLLMFLTSLLTNLLNINLYIYFTLKIRNDWETKGKWRNQIRWERKEKKKH